MFAAMCLAAFIATGDAKPFQHHPFLYPDVLALRLPGTSSTKAHSLQSPMLARNQYWHTGNRDEAERNLAALNMFFKQLKQFETASGLLAVPREYLPTPWPSSLAADLGRAAPVASTDPLINAFYIQALQTTALLARDLEASPVPYEKAAERARQSYLQSFGEALRGAGETPPISGADRALAFAFNVVAPEDVAAVLIRLRASGPPADPYVASFAIDAALNAGDNALAETWLQADAGRAWRNLIASGGATAYPTLPVEPSSPIYLIADRIFGLSPATPGWTSVRVAAGGAFAPPSAAYNVPVPAGRISIRPHPVVGISITAPPGVTVHATQENVSVVHSMSHARATLSSAQKQMLAAHDWTNWAGDRAGIWVSVAEQMLRVVQNGQVLYQARCATAAKGIGNAINSEQTPLGWHSVAQKLGANAPWGQVFRARAATREVWKPGGDTREDLVLTRVLLLDGQEPGVNKGGNVDSRARYIYIHGTNDEARIGTPSSHGCVRLRNDDVIELFELVDEGTPVLITEL